MNPVTSEPNAGTRADLPEGKVPEAEVGEALRAKVESLPRDPGAYLMKSARGEILYVGKAKDLRSRVRSYFAAAPGDTRPHIRLLVPKVADVEVLVTDSEKEALLLENTLIKKHRPRFNLRLRDDKTYVCLKVTVQDEYPRILVERRPKHDGSLIFGPYSSAQAVRETIKQIRRIFPLRTCSNRQMANRTRPCLDCQIHHCLAPCVGPVDEAGYREAVEGAILFLKGRSGELRAKLEERMAKEAAELRFEEAATLRDRIRAVELTLERQKVCTQADVDQDVLGFHREGDRVEIAVLAVRRGLLTGSRTRPLDRTEIPDEEVFTSFVKQTYAEREDLPDEIVLPLEIEDAELLGAVLSERKGRKVSILTPQRGEKRSLVELACENARVSFESRKALGDVALGALEGLRRKLGLARLPRRIECFDISNFQGKLSVGSMVVFESGEPVKDAYRRFRIRTKDAPDDYAMMREVLERRVLRAREEETWPDLILVDGGKGHLHVATTVLHDLGVDEVDAASIAKGEGEEAAHAPANTPSPKDRVFIPGRKGHVPFRANDPALLLLQRVRDEAHRFAVGYHRLLRSRAALASSIEGIPGVGPARRRQLIMQFKGLTGLRAASLEEIASVPGISRATAEAVHRFLRGSDSSAR